MDIANYVELENSLQKLVNIIKVQPGIKKIIVFGSYARKEVTEKSDLDVLVIQDTDMPWYKRLTGLSRQNVKVSVDMLVFTPDEFEELKTRTGSVVIEALKEGITVYEEQSAVGIGRFKERIPVI